MLSDHLWLHVDGKYIKTSPYANPANEIFMPVGVDWPHLYGGIKEDWDWTAKWLKDNGCNMIRISFETLPWPIGRKSIDGYNCTSSEELDNVIENHIAPCVEVLKNHQIYCYLDQHEYMHRIRPDSDRAYDHKNNIWTNEDFQVWIDHWVKIADYFKNEPWVMGYELCNEPVNMPASLCQKRCMECIKAIRQVDKRHIILLGSNGWSHTRSAEPTWASVNFRADEPYNQVVFTFHEYTHCDDIYAVSSGYVPGKLQGGAGKEAVSDIIERIQNKYNVPMFCTEFGSAETGVKNIPDEEKRQFEKDMIECCYNHRMGWSIWLIAGNYTDSSEKPGWGGRDRYEDVWIPKAKKQGSPIPKPGKKRLK